MGTAQQGVRDYVLGNSPQEQERLKLQGSIVSGWTERILLSACLERGMSVLDLGCGIGDVSLLAVELVGPSGTVTGIDRDPAVIESARKRAAHQGHCAPIDFRHVELLHFHFEKTKFDAVIGRYFLLYQPDPVLAIRHAAAQVRPGGIVCFHEVDFGNMIRSYPDHTLFSKMYAVVGETFHRAGIPADFGLRLTTSFLRANLSPPQLRVEVPIGGEPGSYLYGWATETLRSLLPRIEQFGLGTSQELDLDTLAERMETEAVALQSQLIGPLQFGAWTRNV